MATFVDRCACRVRLRMMDIEYLDFTILNLATKLYDCDWLVSRLPRGAGSIHNVTVQENYADTKVFINRGTNCPMIGNTVFEPGHPPPAAVKIMNASGVNSSNPFLGDVRSV